MSYSTPEASPSVEVCVEILEGATFTLECSVEAIVSTTDGSAEGESRTMALHASSYCSSLMKTSYHS